MAFNKFQDFLGGLVARQRDRFSKNGTPTIEELLERLMGNSSEVSAIVAARELLDIYKGLDEEGKKDFFVDLEQNFNAKPAAVKLAYESYEAEPTSANLNHLARVAEPRRVELIRRLNQTPGATHDLVAMRTDLLALLRDHPELKAVDENFTQLFRSWFGRGFLVLQTIDWSTSASILNRIIRYEAVHAIKDWDDLRGRVDPPNRRCFAFFHPALTDEPLIFVEVALSTEIPNSISSILNDTVDKKVDPSKFTTATFYSISNCQPGLKNISFGNFLIKQVVQELKAEFPSIKQFVTLSPVPGFKKWLEKDEDEEVDELRELKADLRAVGITADNVAEHGESIRKLVLNYLLLAKRGKYPLDSVARFHLGNGAQLHKVHASADLSSKGLAQSCGSMVNYLYDLRSIEQNHEEYITEGNIEFNDKLKPLLLKVQ